jgi:hypothetical protein
MNNRSNIVEHITLRTQEYIYSYCITEIVEKLLASKLMAGLSTIYNIRVFTNSNCFHILAALYV